MNLEKNVRKMKLKPFTDELKCRFAISEDSPKIYEQYDYYRLHKGRLNMYSKKFLEDKPYRELKQSFNRCNNAGFKNTVRKWFYACRDNMLLVRIRAESKVSSFLRQ